MPSRHLEGFRVRHKNYTKGKQNNVIGQWETRLSTMNRGSAQKINNCNCLNQKQTVYIRDFRL